MITYQMAFCIFFFSVAYVFFIMGRFNTHLFFCFFWPTRALARRHFAIDLKNIDATGRWASGSEPQRRSIAAQRF